ncbi:hypothetical protein THAOC_30048 [Thalassiosira oceanica]|uniref:Uncharacterized protein n=1 Tax=Thalassiosira oceanica TaxID=159749 RepID=K0RPL8_THAOC|nr:hypothetical protein THAOC_30048 [Thalassiosira oceanica]|eukprot:EJK50846.1 hypothetical protein THAOC_30048 [Thalassiosira oceanica]
MDASLSCCESIIQHYSDPVHARVSLDNERRVPYFDLPGNAVPSLSPICAVWHKKLSGASASGDDANRSGSHHADIARDLLSAYGETLHLCQRPRCDTKVKTAATAQKQDLGVGTIVEVVQQYELLVAHFACHNVAPSDDADKVEGEDKRTQVGADNCSADSEPSFDSEEIARQILEDIMQWTTKLPNDKENLWKIQNNLLPCLLRLLRHAIALLRERDLNESKPALVIATVAAVAFVGDGTMDCGSINLGNLLRWALPEEAGGESSSLLSLASALDQCNPCPLSVIRHKEEYRISRLTLTNNFLTRSAIDWTSKSSCFEAGWSDSDTGIAARTAMDLMMEVLSILEPKSRGNLSLFSMLQNICRHVGVKKIASAARAHFFGRLVGKSVEIQPRQNGGFMPMIKRINDDSSGEDPNNREKPHIETPMRIPSAVVLLSAALSCPGSDDDDEMDTAYLDALPVGLSLLDDAQSLHQGLGASMLVSVCESACSQVEKGSLDFVSRYGQLIASVLEEEIRISGRDDPTILGTVCLASSKFVKLLVSSRCSVQGLSATSLARKFVIEMFNAITTQIHTCQNGNNERISAVLAAGVNPILAQLATCREAASVEVARKGLSVLLPVIGWSGMDIDTRSAQAVALSSLVSLLVGAYPIMPRKGKQIMIEIILLLDRCTKDTAFLNDQDASGRSGSYTNDMRSATETIAEIARFSAAVCLAVCEDSAASILGHVESTQQRDELLDDIRFVADYLKA